MVYRITIYSNKTGDTRIVSESEIELDLMQLIKSEGNDDLIERAADEAVNDFVESLSREVEIVD